MSLFYDMCTLCMAGKKEKESGREKRTRERSKNEIHSEKLYIKLCLTKWKRFSALTKASIYIGKCTTAAALPPTGAVVATRTTTTSAAVATFKWMNSTWNYAEYTHTHTVTHEIERAYGYAIVHRSISACASAFSKRTTTMCQQVNEFWPFSLTIFVFLNESPKYRTSWLRPKIMPHSALISLSRSFFLFLTFARSLSIYSSIYTSVNLISHFYMDALWNSRIWKCDNILRKVGIFYIYNGHNLNKWVDWISIFML